VVVLTAFWLGDFTIVSLVILWQRKPSWLPPDSFADNGNVALGRIAGSFIVPNMVMAHPHSGLALETIR
jgi:hypothetical protein